MQRGFESIIWLMNFGEAAALMKGLSGGNRELVLSPQAGFALRRVTVSERPVMRAALRGEAARTCATVLRLNDMTGSPAFKGQRDFFYCQHWAQSLLKC